MKVSFRIESGNKLIAIDSNTEKKGCWISLDESNRESKAYLISPEEARDIYNALGLIFGFRLPDGNPAARKSD